MKTKIVFILDRSGSMGNLASDVIGGFNQFLADQKKLKGKAYLTVVLFDDKYEVLMKDVEIQDVKPLTEREYFVRGTTALLDAVGKTVTTVKADSKKRDKVLVFINTDGFENASVEYDNKKVKEVVEDAKKLGWNFVFLGANIDSFSVGGAMGITVTSNYTASAIGTRSVYDTTSNLVASYRANPSKTVTNEDLNTVQ